MTAAENYDEPTDDRERLLSGARAWWDAGFAVIPSHDDGTKRPMGRWREFQKVRPTWQQVEQWLRSGRYDGIGIITGSASDDVECIEIEGPLPAAVERLEKVTALAVQWGSDVQELLARVARGCIEQSAGGGLHLLNRSLGSPVPGNTKLAHTGHGADRKVVAETRGEGGFLIVAPSPGRRGHAQGSGYTLLLDSTPDGIAVVTAAERQVLHDLFRAALDEPEDVGPVDVEPEPPQRTSSTYDGVSTFDDYRARVKWREILEPVGWTWHSRDATRDYWTRPGKDARDGHSASTIEDGPMWVFSSSTDFPQEEALTKPQVYAHLHHGGDLSAAARALLDQGYGSRPERPALRHFDYTPPDGPTVTVMHDQSEAGRYIGSDGLRVASLSAAIAAACPIGIDGGDGLWTYRGGVWKLDPQVVTREVAIRLGERFRSSHANTTQDFITAMHAQRLTQAPTPNHINVRNGMLDWRTGDLLPHGPEYLSTVQLPIDYDPEATCPRFDAWLAEVLPADLLDGERGGFIWEVIGYLCMSGNPFHKAILLLGGGRNGKGTFLRFISRLLGAENVSAVTLHDLTTNRFRAADLLGKVANIAGDLDATALDSTGLFKALTGGDLVHAERKYGGAFSFTPWAVPVFSANQVWRSADTSAGYLSRWVTIPFPNSFEGREDRSLDDVLGTPAELQGALVKGIRALRAAMDRGNFSSPESVAAEHRRFTEQSDPIRAFIRAVSEPEEGGFITRSELWKVYRLGWVEDEGLRQPLTRNKFYEALRGAGLREGKRKDSGYLDRRLTATVVDDLDLGIPGRRRLRYEGEDA